MLHVSHSALSRSTLEAGACRTPRIDEGREHGVAQPANELVINDHHAALNLVDDLLVLAVKLDVSAALERKLPGQSSERIE